MSEEIPFKSMKITLSDEAMSRLEGIMNIAKFRSNSSTVEECIRVVYDIMHEIFSVCGNPGEDTKSTTITQEREAFTRIGMRMSRFTSRVACPSPKEEKVVP